MVERVQKGRGSDGAANDAKVIAARGQRSRSAMGQRYSPKEKRAQGGKQANQELDWRVSCRWCRGAGQGKRG